MKHENFSTRIFLLFIVCVFLIFSCKQEIPEIQKFTVTYLSEIESTPEEITVNEGTVLSEEYLPIMAADNYIFDGWYEGEIKIEPGNYTVTHNITLKAKWKPLEYTVVYQSDFGKIPDTLTLPVNTILTIDNLPEISAEGYIFNGWYYDEIQIQADSFKLIKDITLKAKWDYLKYTITYKTEHGSTPESVSLPVNTILEVEDLPIIEADNYIFEGWYDNETKVEPNSYIITSDIILSAKWTNDSKNIESTSKQTSVQIGIEHGNTELPSTLTSVDEPVENPISTVTIASYSVKHFQQNIIDDNYTLIVSDTEIKNGLIGKKTNALAKTYIGFVAKSFTQMDIVADGSTEVCIYYERIVTNYTFNAAGGNWNDSTENIIISGRYGATVSIKQPVRQGYYFSSWNENVPQTFGTEEKTYSAVWISADYTLYTVKHFKQNLTGNSINDYTEIINDRETKIGITGANTDAVARIYTGFNVKTFEQGTIAADNSTVVNIYYDRVITTYTFNACGGSWNDTIQTKSITGRYGTTVKIPDNPIFNGHKFTGWNNTIPSTFGVDELTFEGQWDLITWTINFDSRGGTPVPSMIVDYLSRGQTPLKSSKSSTVSTKYIFVGWFSSNDNGVTLSDSPYDFANSENMSDITLYAKWDVIPIYYTVTFNSTGGTEITSQRIRGGENAIEPTIPIKESCSFDGWYFNDTKFNFLTTQISSDIILEAKWEIIPVYTVSFNSDGGTLIYSQNIEKGKNAIKPEDPYKERYNFVGWFVDEYKFDFSTPITSNITLKAKWDGQVFIVAFDSDGGTEINDQYINKYGYSRQPSNPKKESCKFDGWYLNDTRFNFSNTQITSDITLKAKWVQLYTISFDSDGGTNIQNKTVESGKTVTKPNTPSKEKYTFLGWFNGESEFDFSLPITSDISLKAKWEKKVMVTFDFKGARSNVEQLVEKGNLVTSQNAYWTNHAFKGWYYGDSVFDFSTPIITDITLTAKWLNIYTVKFDYNDPSSTIEIKNIEEGQLITDVPYTSKKTGYTLAAWLINGTEFDFENSIITSNITLTAKYYCNSITSTLTMKQGWGERDFHNLPIVEVAIVSCKGKALDSNSVIKCELTYPWKSKNLNNHDVDFITETIGEFSHDGHNYAFDLWRTKVGGDEFRVRSRAFSPYETKYSILEVKRDSTKNNMYGKRVDVITIYIDIDF